jgi:alpha-galactosidase
MRNLGEFITHKTCSNGLRGRCAVVITAWALASCLNYALAADVTDFRADSVNHRVYYRSGPTYYSEALLDGRWRGISWGAGAENQNPRSTPGDDAFELRIKDHPTPPAVAGTALDAGWQWVGTSESPGRSPGSRDAVVKLHSLVYPVDLKVHTLLDGTAILGRWLEITNLSSRSIALTELAPFSGYLWPADAAVTVGHALRWEERWEGWFGWTPLQEGRNVFDQDRGLTADDPYFILQNPSQGEYFFGELGWPVSYRMTFDRNRDGIRFAIGPREYNALRVIEPNETVSTPVVHLGPIRGDFDDAVQAMHSHIRASVLPQQALNHPYPIKYNLTEDQTEQFVGPMGSKVYDEEGVRKKIDVAAAAGMEVVNLSGPGWAVTYGDWDVPKPALFPHGIQALAEYAHSKGVLFSLYFEAEGGRSGRDSCPDPRSACILDWRYSKIYREHPDWFVPPRSILNLTIPEAEKYFDTEVSHLIDYYRLDMYRQDFNAYILGRGSETLRDGFLENDHWRHYEALRRVFDHLRQTHPDKIIFAASAGGMRLDLESLSIFYQTTTTDRASLPYLYRTAAGLSSYLPPEVLINPNGMAKELPDLDTILRGAYALGNTPLIYNHVLPESMDEFPPEKQKKFQHYAQLYKTFFRPLMPTCKVYHFAPVDAGHDVEFGNWFAMEFTSPDGDKGWSTVIRMSESRSDTYHLKFTGLQNGRLYTVKFENINSTESIEGSKLMRDGVLIRLQPGQYSELIRFEEK